MLSVIIPARNEDYLEKTIRNILENAEGEIEILVALDGYLPEPPIHMNDERVIFVHYPESIGQRQAMNKLAEMAKGQYIMKLDAHCAVGKGFDVILANDCQYDWTMIPRMYNLDVETWTPKLHKRTDYMYIGNEEGRTLRAEYYSHGQPDNDMPIDDTMCCMGPGFFMHKDRYWELGGMDENHGSWGQMGVELACKAWLSGGALKVNKKTWFAHWFRGGGPGFPYPASGRAHESARKYSRDLWLNNKWPLQKRQFQWLIEKFTPPGWDMVETGYPYMNIPYEQGKIILDLGCGTRPKRKGITNVDIRNLPNVEAVMDLRELTYDDNSVDTIISSDVLEHFGRHEIASLLKEWFRVLKPGGKAYISTVDIGRTMEGYKDVPEYKWLDAVYGGQKYATDFHKMGFTKESFIRYMKDAGFETTGIKRFTLHRNPRMTVFARKREGGKQ